MVIHNPSRCDKLQANALKELRGKADFKTTIPMANHKNEVAIFLNTYFIFVLRKSSPQVHQVNNDHQI